MTNHPHDPVTDWLNLLHDGDQDAVANLWRRYFNQLAEIARRQLGNNYKRVSDEEDVALSVLDTLVRGVANGRFSDLRNRRDLWCLLITLTNRKVVDLKRHATRLKRGGGKVTRDSELADLGFDMTLDDLCDTTPTPEYLSILSEKHLLLMGELQKDELKQIAQLTLEEYTSAEIARKLEKSQRTIQRKQTLIREIWINAMLAGDCDAT